MYILDTNVVSELMRPKPDDTVWSWVADQEVSNLYLTAINVAELRYGHEIMPLGKNRNIKGEILDHVLKFGFADRILSIDVTAAEIYAEIAARRRAAGRPIAQFYGLIGAVALSYGMMVATRNISDFENLGLNIVNPWIDV